jgi:hypothetical protein
MEHLSVVPGHLRTSKASQASQRFESARLLTNRVERWLILLRFISVGNCRRRGPLYPHFALLTITRIDDHLPPDWVIIFPGKP